MAIKGHSTLLKYGDSAGTYPNKLGKVTEVTPPTVEAEDIDVSHMESPEQYDEFEPGWANGGDTQATLQMSSDDVTTALSLFRVPKFWQVLFSNGSSWRFPGYLKSIGTPVDRKGIVTIAVTVKVTGKPTFDTGGGGS